MLLLAKLYLLCKNVFESESCLWTSLLFVYSTLLITSSSAFLAIYFWNLRCKFIHTFHNNWIWPLHEVLAECRPVNWPLNVSNSSTVALFLFISLMRCWLNMNWMKIDLCVFTSVNIGEKSKHSVKPFNCFASYCSWSGEE